jgi:phenylacetate-CoA ligase
MNLKPEIEFLPVKDINVLQTQKLRELLQYLQVKSPFYRGHFADHNVSFDSITGLEDLQKIPPTTKDDLQRQNWDFVCVPRGEIAEYTTTSGTMGKPVTIALTAKDIKRLAYNEAISFACADGSSHDMYHLMLTLDRQFMAGLAYYEGIRMLGAGLVRVGPGLPEMQWEVIERLKPTTIVGVPSFILKLAEAGIQHGIDLNNTSVKKAVCIGENIRTPELQQNAIASRIKSLWNIHLYGTYASTEMQTAFTECGCGTGGHHHPELLIVELLDENNNRVIPGSAGEITITTLGIEGMPLLRYKTGDIASAFHEACGCGRTTLRLGPILGRKQQLLKFKGTTVYPPAIMDILQQQLAVTDFAVEAFSNEFGNDEIRLYVVGDEHARPKIQQELNARFQSKLRVIPQIVFILQPELDKKMAGSPVNRKVKRFIDSRISS